MLKTACLVGAHAALAEAGLIPALPLQKCAEVAGAAAQALPQEIQAAGEFITPQDLESLAKILDVLSQLQQMYMQQSGGQGAPGGQGGMPPMDPAMMGGQGGMPPMDPAMMAQMQGGAPMPPAPQGMPGQM